MFKEFTPEDKEINIARAYDGEVDDLDDASKFIYFFKDVPAFLPRCQYVIFAKSCEEQLADVEGKLVTLGEGVATLMKNT